jgi:ribosomal protein S18 acetylase RimI-like enzyme
VTAVLVQRFSAADFARHRTALNEILRDAVDSGAGVSFVAPLPEETGNHYWEGVETELLAGTAILLGGFWNDQLKGTVQLDLATPPNQPHRCDIRKLLVHRSARGQGIGRALMLAAEREAVEADRTLLTLDTQTGSVAESLYRKLGYISVGTIPGYALDGFGQRLVSTTIFYKQLAQGEFN